MLLHFCGSPDFGLGDQLLPRIRAKMEKQLEEMGSAIGGARIARGGRGTSALRGRKVAAKYRGPAGETSIALRAVGIARMFRGKTKKNGPPYLGAI